MSVGATPQPNRHDPSDRSPAQSQLKIDDSTPVWKTGDPYEDLQDTRYLQRRTQLASSILAIKQDAEIVISKILPQFESGRFNVSHLEFLEAFAKTYLSTKKDVSQLSAFVRCTLYKDGSDKSARDEDEWLESQKGSLRGSAQALWLAMRLIPDHIYNNIMNVTELVASRSEFDRRRSCSAQSLTVREEQDISRRELAERFAPARRARFEILSRIKIEIANSEGEKITVGLAQADRMLQEISDEPTRRNIYRAREEALTPHREELAAIQVRMKRFCIETDRLRAERHGIEINPQHTTLEQNRVEQATLQTCMGVLEKRRAELVQIPAIFAKALGKEHLDAHDLQAPMPGVTKAEIIPFGLGVRLALETANAISSEVGDFVAYAYKAQLIDAKTTNAKTAVSNCSYYPESKELRFSINWNGGYRSLQSMVHELVGHGYAINLLLQAHPFNVADDTAMVAHEIPSNFAEIMLFRVFAESSLGKINPHAKEEAEWHRALKHMRMLLYLPCVFKYECELFEAISKNKDLAPEQLEKMWENILRAQFGSTLGENEKLGCYTRQHLYFAEPEWALYNWPYTVSYLVARVLDDMREKQGDAFVDNYKNLIKDLPCESLEDLLKKHMGVDLRSEEFWNHAIDLCMTDLKRFAELVDLGTFKVKAA